MVLQRAISGMCGERQPLLVSNFTGKMVYGIRILRGFLGASPMIMKDYSSDRAFFEQAFENPLT